MILPRPRLIDVALLSRFVGRGCLWDIHAMLSEHPAVNKAYGVECLIRTSRGAVSNSFVESNVTRWLYPVAFLFWKRIIEGAKDGVGFQRSTRFREQDGGIRLRSDPFDWPKPGQNHQTVPPVISVFFSPPGRNAKIIPHRGMGIVVPQFQLQLTMRRNKKKGWRRERFGIPKIFR